MGPPEMILKTHGNSISLRRVFSPLPMEPYPSIRIEIGIVAGSVRSESSTSMVFGGASPATRRKPFLRNSPPVGLRFGKGAWQVAQDRPLLRAQAGIASAGR